MMRDKFIEHYTKNIQREGSKELLSYLEKSDFFTAPASTRFHCAHEGGLVEHSVHVYERLREMVEFEKSYSEQFCLHNTAGEETIAICGLLHDLCKINFYAVEMRNRKNERGEWEKYPYYIVDDQLPFGHGEKSQYIVSGFMKLTREESMAIRWHMGFSDETFKGGGFSVGNAFGKFPLAVLLHIADLQSTYLDERESEG